MKKMSAILLALVLVLTLSVSAFASETETPAAVTGSITIINPVAGQTYTIYKIFDLESYNATTGAYAYTIQDNSPWHNFVTTGDGKDYVTVSTNEYSGHYVTWKNGVSAEGAIVAAFAKAALKYAEENHISNNGTIVATEGQQVKFENLPLGYYLVDSTLGALCGLNTTKPNAQIAEKNTPPSSNKEVQEDSTEQWGAANDADINQVVNFKAIISAKKGAKNYVYHDTMSVGLTFQNDVVVKVGETTLTAGTDYTVVTPGNETETETTKPCTFHVVFTESYLNSITADTEIVITYSAKLNENAVVGVEGNPNTSKLEYGDDGHITMTPDSTTKTYTWDAKVIKYTKQKGEDDNETEAMLAGATFKVTTDVAGNNALKFYNLGENKYEHCADAACNKEHVTEITTDTTGSFHIEGLDAGTYYLHETKAPEGYNKLSDAVAVTITGATKGEGNELTYSTVETKVENKTGSELPSTGGIGTTIFYVVGALMMAFAVVMLVTRKKMAADND